MDKKLDGQVAIVTGASSGIGAACAVELAAAVVLREVGTSVVDQRVDRLGSRRSGGCPDPCPQPVGSLFVTISCGSVTCPRIHSA
jgi:NAD(P)-dependent dehydrogenase (short-subunit alcohol dehydrogenase family)